MYNVALLGSPNAGKTTIFNALTGQHAKTGNWHGVTVEERSAKIKNSDITLFDLPGIYTLNAFSPEEKVSENYVDKNPDSLFLSVVPAVDFLRGIKTTINLLAKGRKTALVLTFFDEFIKQGGKINLNKIKDILKIPVIAINGNNKKDVKKLEKFTKIAVNNTYEHTLDVKNLTESLLSSIYTAPIFKQNFLDKLLLNKYLCTISFFCVTALVFYLTFGENSLGGIFQNLISVGMRYFTIFVGDILYSVGASIPVVKFVTDGLLGGVLGVLSFVPQLMILYLFLCFLEESGFMARIAFMFDDIFQKIGLNGRAVFSIFMGFGCTAIAELSTKSLDNKSLQKKTALALPFVSCSAKLPVYLVIINAFFAKSKVIVLFGIYLFGLVLAGITALILDKFVYKSKQTFIMELPPLRIVSVKKLSKTLLYYLKQFIIKVGSTIAVVITALWFLKSFSLSLVFIGDDIGASILGEFGKWLKYLFYPMGVTDWRISVSVLSGLFAKEAIVGTLELLCGSDASSLLTPAQAFAFLIFCMAYTPCLSALATLKKQVGLKLALICGVGTFIFALILGYVTYFFALVIQALNVNPALVIFLIVVMLCITVGKGSLKNKCSNCQRCTDGKNEGNCKYKKRKVG